MPGFGEDTADRADRDEVEEQLSLVSLALDAAGDSIIIHRPDGSEDGGLLAGTPVGAVLDSALSTVSQAVPLPVDVAPAAHGAAAAVAFGALTLWPAGAWRRGATVYTHTFFVIVNKLCTNTTHQPAQLNLRRQKHRW